MVSTLETLNSAIGAVLTASLPQEMSMIVAQYAKESLLLVVGGIEPNALSANVLAFDPTKKCWETCFLPTLQLPTQVTAVTVEENQAIVHANGQHIGLNCDTLVKAVTMSRQNLLTRKMAIQLVSGPDLVISPPREQKKNCWSLNLYRGEWRYIFYGGYDVEAISSKSDKQTSVMLPHSLSPTPPLMYRGRLIVGGGEVMTFEPVTKKVTRNEPNQAVSAVPLANNGSFVGTVEELAPLSKRVKEIYGRDRKEPMVARLVVIDDILFALQIINDDAYSGCENYVSKYKSNVLLRYLHDLNIWEYCAFMPPRTGFGTLVL